MLNLLCLPLLVSRQRSEECNGEVRQDEEQSHEGDARVQSWQAEIIERTKG